MNHPDGRARLVGGLAALVAFVWPFVYLFPYILPMDGKFVTIGNDFQILYYWYKAGLLDSLANFDVPWWSPAEGAGFPFYASPFTQTFYPLNVPLAAYYSFAGGYQLIDHQRFAVLGIAIFTLGLYLWLRSLRFETRIALAAAMVLGVSFKLTELLRFPNALHTAAWYPWILLFMTRIAGSETTRARVINGTLLAFAAICMITGGYPYYVLYSPWLFGPYLLVLLVPRWSRALLDREPVNVKAALATLAAAGLATVVIAGPYIYKMSALMKQTTDRAGASFNYSTEHVFDYQDTIGSWLFPPASNFEGWYYFGIINVLLVLLAVVRRPRTPVLLFLLAWVAVVTYITYGRSSYLFILLWNYMPGYSSLRVWGRMNIILVPILAWLVAIAYRHFESLIASQAPEEATGRRRLNWRPLLLLAAIFAVTFAVQQYARAGGWHDRYWNMYYVGDLQADGKIVALLEYLKGWGLKLAVKPPEIHAFAERESVVAGVIAAVAIGILLIGASFVRRGGRSLPRLVLAVTVAIAALDMWVVGPWVWAFGMSPELPRRRFDIAGRNVTSFVWPRIENSGYSATGPFATGIMPNWYFDRYVKFLKWGAGEPQPMKQFLGMVDARKVYFSDNIAHPSIQAFLDDAGRFQTVTRVVRYNGDEISIGVTAPGDGYVSFIDNWDPDWKAIVDGEPVPIQLLFGTFKSVPVRAGRHLVKFVYRPFWP